MTQQQKIMLTEQLLAMGDLYGRPLTEGGVLMFIGDLADLPFEQVLSALGKYRRLEASRAFPTVGQIRALISPELTVEDEANDATTRIVEAMAKYGYTNPEKARTHIGELGWTVVQREGGWQALCERTTSDDLPFLKSQWIKTAKSLRAQAQRGTLDKPPGLLPGSTEAIEKHLGLDKAKGPLPVTFAEPARTLPGNLRDYATFGDDGRLMADKHTMPINNYPRGEK